MCHLSSMSEDDGVCSTTYHLATVVTSLSIFFISCQSIYGKYDLACLSASEPTTCLSLSELTICQIVGCRSLSATITYRLATAMTSVSILRSPKSAEVLEEHAVHTLRWLPDIDSPYEILDEDIRDFSIADVCEEEVTAEALSVTVKKIQDSTLVQQCSALSCFNTKNQLRCSAPSTKTSDF